MQTMDIFVYLILVLVSVKHVHGLPTLGGTGRMAGGSSSNGMYPWVARIEISGELICHGSLIDERFVLTAAGCVLPAQVENATVLLGRFDLNSPTTKDNVTAVLQTIAVKQALEVQGVLLLELDCAANMSYPYVGIVSLATPDQESKITKKHKCYESGFGETKPGLDPTELQTIKLSIDTKNKKCKKIKEFNSTEEMCMAVKKAGPCAQDKGTAVVCYENTGKTPGDLLQVAVETIKTDKKPKKNACFGGKALAPLRVAGIREHIYSAIQGNGGDGGTDDCPLKYRNITTGHTRCADPSDRLLESGLEVGDKEQIVEYHNDVRRNRLPVPATNMQIMSWSDEIALTAQRLANTCVFDHDGNYKRYEFGLYSVGQNLALGSSNMGWNRAMEMWADEVTDFRYGEDPAGVVGHYTQMVWADTSKVGCGYAHCTDDMHLFVCNYAPAGNYNFKTPYQNGTSCDDCKTKCNDKLCECPDIDVCYNGGTKDLEACTCSCKSNLAHFVQPKCALTCVENVDPGYCEGYYTSSACEVYSNVPQECPFMCKWCPAAETA